MAVPILTVRFKRFWQGWGSRLAGVMNALNPHPSDSFNFGGEFVWHPSKQTIEQSRLKQFIDRYGLTSFEELHHRSVTDLEWFWQAVLDDLQIEFYQPYERIVDTSQGLPWTRWCVGGKMNIVHNCLDKWISTAAQDRIAIQFEGEDGIDRAVSYAELYSQVSVFANALRSIGVAKGDVVAIYLP